MGQLSRIFRQTANWIELKFGGATHHMPPQASSNFGHAPLNSGSFSPQIGRADSAYLQTKNSPDLAQIWRVNPIFFMTQFEWIMIFFVKRLFFMFSINMINSSAAIE